MSDASVEKNPRFMNSGGEKKTNKGSLSSYLTENLVIFREMKVSESLGVVRATKTAVFCVCCCTPLCCRRSVRVVLTFG